MNFQLLQHYNYSLSDLEYMLPWEREIYLALLLNHLKEEEQRNRERESKGY